MSDSDSYDSYDSDGDTSDADSIDLEDLMKQEPTVDTINRSTREVREWKSLNHGLTTSSLAIAFGELTQKVYPDQNPGKTGRKKIRQGKARLREGLFILNHDIPYLQYLAAPVEPLPEQYAYLDYIAGERTRMMAIKSIEALAAETLAQLAELAARPTFVTLGIQSVMFGFDIAGENPFRETWPDEEWFLYRATAHVNYQAVM